MQWVASTGWSQWLFTDEHQLPRDYRRLTSLQRVDAKLWDQVPWQEIGPGQRRRVLFNDRLTMVWLELDPAPPQERLMTHYHAHDQVTMIVEGKARVRVGNEELVVGPGAAYVAPSNVHHGLQPLSSRVVLVECFTPTREDFRGSRGPGPSHRCGPNQVRALVYDWFSLFDRQAAPQDFLERLDPQGWKVRFAEQELQSEAEFSAWWQGVSQRYPVVSHDVRELELEPEKDGYRVRLLVGWSVAGKAPLWFRQSWFIRDWGGWPVIGLIESTPASAP